MPKSKPKPFSNFVKDLIGKKFGRLTVIGFSGLDKCKKAQWRCLCNCGKLVSVAASSLRSSLTRSCGCFHQERLRAVAYKHGHADHRNGAVSVEYYAWISMKQRCTNPKRHNYKNYGGRGIVVCDRWRDSFINFLADVGERPGPEFSLDRINNDGNYEPGNVRWATRSQQQRNTTKKTLSDSDIALAIKLRR